MEISEAKKILAEQIEILKKTPYKDLCEYMKDMGTFEVSGKSGKKYGISICSGRTRDKSRNKLKVIVSIDERGSKTPTSIVGAFIISPDGSSKNIEIEDKASHRSIYELYDFLRGIMFFAIIVIPVFILGFFQLRDGQILFGILSFIPGFIFLILALMFLRGEFIIRKRNIQKKKNEGITKHNFRHI